jgi:hypothetical protein
MRPPILSFIKRCIAKSLLPSFHEHIINNTQQACATNNHIVN